MIHAVQNSGLAERDLKTLNEIFTAYPEIKKIYLFGSRAKGNPRPGSDIDLAVMNENVSDEVIRKVKARLEESSLPYHVDLLNYSTLQHDALKAHIARVGTPLYYI